MTRAAGRACAAAVLAALAASVFLAGFYVWHPALTIDFDADPPLVTGLYPVERDPSGVTFAWTGREMTLLLPGLDRRVAWQVEIRLRGGRERPASNPDVAVVVDGAELSLHHTRGEFDDVGLTIPPRPDRPWGAVVLLRSSSTFVPGASDPRSLGVMLDRVTVVPAGAVLPPRAAFAGAAIGAAVLGAAIALLGVTAGSAVVGAALLSAGEAAVIARGSAPFTEFPFVAARTAVAIAFALIALAWMTQAIRRQPLRNTARFAAAFSAAALFLELLVLLHPDVAPFAARASGSTRVAIAVCAADAIAGVLLYRTLATASGDRLIGALGVALYQLAPWTLAGLVGGHPGDAVVVPLAALALTMLTDAARRPGWRPAAIGLAAVTALATGALVMRISPGVARQPAWFAVFAASLLALAALGVRHVWRRHGTGEVALTLAAAGWLIGCALLVLPRIVTPVVPPGQAAAVPAVVAVAAIGAGRGWKDGGPSRTAATVLLAAAVWAGVRGWWSALG